MNFRGSDGIGTGKFPTKILKFIIDADFALCYNSPEMNKGVHEVWPHGRLFFISFKKVRPMK